MKNPRWINEIPKPIPINENNRRNEKRGRRVFNSC